MTDTNSKRVSIDEVRFTWQQMMGPSMPFAAVKPEAAAHILIEKNEEQFWYWVGLYRKPTPITVSK